MFRAFIESEKSGGFILIACTVVSLLITNSPQGEYYVGIWSQNLASAPLHHWINDGLMTLFFLIIGLELKREFLEGQFADLSKALLPVFAAVGGMLIPAAFHLFFNYGTTTQSGAGIPMATDAAFALAILSIVGKRTPFSLKILLVAVAVVDDLCAIIIIAVFYASDISLIHLSSALGIFLLLLIIRRAGMRSLIFYLVGGVGIWYFLLHSGVHATIAGVLIAITIPYSKGSSKCPSLRLQNRLHKPVAFVVLPLFALANTCIVIGNNFIDSLATPNSIGILSGLVLGKPLGVFLFSFLAVKTGIGKLSEDLKWKHVLGIGILAGIGFTISIFISVLAFSDPSLADQSKMAVLTASVLATMVAGVYLRWIG